MPDELTVTDKLNDLIVQKRNESFTNPEDTEEMNENALGIMIAVHTEWTGAEICRILAYALEDANYHSEASIVVSMAEVLAEGGRVDKSSTVR